MLSHFLKIFIRTTLKNSAYSFINISGLAVGLACSIFIVLWVIDEISFDGFHQDKERIFKVMSNHAFPDGTQTYDDTPGPLAAGLRELPEVTEACRLTFRDRVLLQYEEKSLYERAVYGDPSVFRVFTIPVIAGNPGYPIPDKNSIAISQKLAHRYFGKDDPLGKVFRVNNELDAKVTAVFNDLPQNSSIQFDFILSYEVYAMMDQYNHEWGAWTGGQSYIKLHEGADVKAINKRIHEIFTKPKIWVRWDTNVELFLFPLKEWRLYDSFKNGKQDGGRIVYITTCVIVAVFILLIACINFMNLATARSISRAREIGVRKVIGAARYSLIKQFVGESILIAFISLLFALLIVHLLLPTFNTLTEKQIYVDYADPLILGALTGITLTAGVMAGSYPAFLLSSFKPVNVLKGAFYGLSGVSLRKALVVFQFSLSVILIICAVVIYQQIEYMRTKNLGFDKDNVFYFNSDPELQKNFDAFRNGALQSPAIKIVARSNANPMEIFSGIVLADNAWPGKTKEDNVVFKYLKCDYDLLPSLGFTFLEGRNFSKAFTADSSNYIINEEAARRMKLTDPVGQDLNSPRKGKIVGLIKDFHSTGLKGPIEPVIIAMRPEAANQIFIRYESGHLEAAMQHIEMVYKKFDPNSPLEYAFMDQTFTRQYKDEILIGKLSTCFTMMAIFISCLGLFGLASFTAEKRTREIGVRKVMGATVTELITLLCKDFVQVIGIALIIGLPVAWWIAQKLLAVYTFHMKPGVEIFMITAFLVIVIALLTVSWQSARAAMANPVKSLRTE
jgi:ABC-type antimicrobial peptide transport system permease subunit